MARETKSQLKQRTGELKRLYAESERHLENARTARDRLEEVKLMKVEGLTDEFEATKRELEVASQALLEAREELTVTKESRETLEGEGDPSGGGRDSEVSHQIKDLQGRLDEADDLADRTQWKLEQLRAQSELETLKAKESLRAEMQKVHSQELRVRDDLIQLLRAKVASLEAGSLVVKAVAVDPVEPKREDRVADTPVEKEVVPTGATRKVTLPTLPRFVGDRSEDGAFEHWTKKLLRHAELEKWTEREKLLQLELHLSGRAKQLYEVLPTEEKASFEKAVEALGRRLQLVNSEALLSAQLMRRKQRPTVNEYAHDFEALFEKSYGRRVGMDEPSKVMLKRDLFVQGLLLKWQEKVVPSATTFGDALHHARLAEEHDRQITEIQRSCGQNPAQKEGTSRKDGGTSARSSSQDTWQGMLQVWESTSQSPGMSSQETPK